ncbi:MAG: zinc ribbon domain-containing protein [candidate division Zixibacteria bacterium]|nr:zinc ribbon domain-containing protein [candidate division Zixibacteria bacterium]
MPMFEFLCLECDNKFEELVLRSDITIHCPQCKSNDLKKLVSGFSSTSTTSSTVGGSCDPSSCGKSGFG